MSTIDRLNILKEELDKELKTNNYKKVINDLLKRISNLEYEEERLNNIIKVKDKYIEQLETLIVNIGNTNYAFCFEVNRDEYMSKMRELKGSDKE